MGRLAGFRHREVVRKLKALGFEFDRQAAGSHEIWFNARTNCYTTVPNHPGNIPEGTLRAILKHAGIEADGFLQAESTVAPYFSWNGCSTELQRLPIEQSAS